MSPYFFWRFLVNLPEPPGTSRDFLVKKHVFDDSSMKIDQNQKLPGPPGTSRNLPEPESNLADIPSRFHEMSAAEPRPQRPPLGSVSTRSSPPLRATMGNGCPSPTLRAPYGASPACNSYVQQRRTGAVLTCESGDARRGAPACGIQVSRARRYSVPSSFVNDETLTKLTKPSRAEGEPTGSHSMRSASSPRERSERGAHR